MTDTVHAFTALAALDRSVDATEALLLEILDEIPDPAETDDLHDLAEIVAATDAAIVLLRRIRAEAGEALARRAPKGSTLVEFDDLPAMTIRWGKNRKEWDTDRLQTEVRQALASSIETRELVDPTTGETVAAAGIQEALSAAWSVVSFTGSNLRVGGVKDLGIDPDEFCSSTVKPPDVQVTRPTPK